MEIISQKAILGTILPKEIVEEYELEEIIENEKYIEFVMRETNNVPNNRDYNNEKIEVKRYTFERLQTFSLKGLQCRITLKKKRWIIQETRKTITSKLQSRAENMKIPKEFAKYLKEVIENQVTDIPRIARIMKICPKTLEKWYRKYLTDMEIEAVESVIIEKNLGERLKIDEVCLHRGDFWTILSNAETKKACGIMKGTKVEELREHLDIFDMKKMWAVKEITLDMSNSFDWIAREYFPNATKVIDRFHVQKVVYDALQEMRVRERKRVIKDERDGITDKKTFRNGDTRRHLLARSRGLLYKPSSQWTESQKERAEILFEEYPDIEKAYEIAQLFKQWYDKRYKREEAKQALHKWYEVVECSKYPSLKEAMETVKRHEGWILNYFRERSTNAYAESLNSKIKLFKTLVRGIRKPEYFIYRLTTYIT